ncbi:TetR/AcrR family transcriptional regulator [Lacticaseibacillus hulanensis]|uniref:TetR/AcrR family transcriptional regulator n=1 Tax=Lacticaseibacillus hulanensis TaxID=2493111 RepID=UPI000FDAE95A|nr:TetR/AcrR family transcriptional regulator [Lacticaseibacillus hulanensis]
MLSNHPHRVDPRIKKTELRLRRALFQNLAQAPINRLSVATITETAGITRGTFYQHYADKDDFIDAVRHDTVTDFIAASVYSQRDDHTQIPRLHVRRALEYLRREDNGFAVLFQNDTEPFIDVLTQELTDAIMRFAVSHKRPATATLNLRDLAAVASVIDVAIFKNWVDKSSNWQADYVAHLIQEASDFAPEEGMGLREFYC